MGIIVILVSCEYYFIRVYENLVQHPSNNISIICLDLEHDKLRKKSYHCVSIPHGPGQSPSQLRLNHQQQQSKIANNHFV